VHASSSSRGTHDPQARRLLFGRVVLLGHVEPFQRILRQALSFSQDDGTAHFSYVLLKGGFSDGSGRSGDVGGCRAGAGSDTARGAASRRKDSKILTGS
jgi:hypothetical protein